MKTRASSLGAVRPHRPVVRQSVSMVAGLGDEHRRRLETVTRLLHVKRGTKIYLPGDPSDRIFLLRTGVIKIATTTHDSREVILAFLHPGEIFGELAVIDEHPRDHTAEAYDDCIVCAIDRDAILRTIQEAPEIGAQITRLIGLRLRTFRSRIEGLLCRSAHARVAHALLDLAERHGVADLDGVIIPLRISQGDLARLVGLTRETVNAIVQECRAQHVLEADRRSIRLRHPHRLREAVSQPAVRRTASERTRPLC